ncbi:30S ribosomal protein S13 [candidate division WOR-3 bacterium]|nr:30S ribosomal protein S13 [candidate division WOR-3 bacterium]
MARISGVDLPSGKQVETALTYIYGIGRTSSIAILKKTGVPGDKRVKDLNEKEVEAIRKEIEKSYRVEGAYRVEISNNIKRLISIGAYRGTRHKLGLPVRGQRTKTNARTRKGPSKGAIALKKKKSLGKKG